MTTPGPTTSSTQLRALVEQLDSAYPGAGRLALLADMRRIIEAEIGAEARTMTHRHGTWADVGRLLGVSKQAAWERYRAAPR